MLTKYSSNQQYDIDALLLIVFIIIMLRLIIRGLGAKSFSRQLEPQKKPKAVEKQKTGMTEAMEKERINKMYL